MPFRCGRLGLSQGVPSTCLGGEDFRRNYADDGLGRSLPRNREIPAGRCTRRCINPLSGRNILGNREAPEWQAGCVRLAAAVALVMLTVTWAVEAATSPTGMKNGYTPGPFVFLGSVGLIAIIGDIRMLRGGVSGVRRIARHLWRMCFALFIASASIFLARQRLFPHFMRASGTLYLLSFLPLVLMIFWLFRVRGNRRSSRQLVHDAALSAASSDQL